MKKRVKIFASVLTLVSLIATGCGGTATNNNSSNNSSSNNSSSNSSNSTGVLTPTGEYPIVAPGESLTLSVFAPLRTGVSSYDVADNDFTQWLVEKTGLTFEFQSTPGADRQTRLNTLMTSGTYPEVLLDSYFSPSELLLYGQQGAIIPLEDLIAEHAPNIAKVLDENPEVREAITMEDGHIYSLPTIGGNVHGSVPYKMWINKVWLDNLGLEVPTTIDDFKEVLIAFRDKDPNGNGLKDEVPLTGSLNGWNTDPTVFLANSFGYFEPSQGKSMRIEDGKVVYTKTTDGWKQTLDFMGDLYSEGLLDSLTYSQTADELKKLGNNPGDNVVGVCSGGSVASFMNVGASDRWKDYVTVPPLDGTAEETYAVTMDQYIYSLLNITNQCKNPEAVIRAFDLMFTEEGVVGNILGIEGIDYSIGTEEHANFDGEQPKFVRITNDSERGNRVWNQMGPWYRPPEFDLWFDADPDSIETVLYNETMDKYLDKKAPIEVRMPLLALSQEQSRVAIDVETPLNSHVDLYRTDIVTGKKSVDDTWDEYVKQAEALGLSTYLEVMQTQYDAKK